MKNTKNALLGLLLATAAAASSAAAITGYDFVMGTPGAGTRQDFHFTIGDSTVMKGDTFSYDLLFNTPPLAPTTYFGFYATGYQPDTVTFDNAMFTDLLGNSINNYAFSFDSIAVSGSGFLDSGTYDLFVSGTFLSDGAFISGAAVDDLSAASIPEPMSLSLLGIGLAGMAGLRRKKQA